MMAPAFKPQRARARARPSAIIPCILNRDYDRHLARLFIARRRRIHRRSLDATLDTTSILLLRSRDGARADSVPSNRS